MNALKRYFVAASQHASNAGWIEGFVFFFIAGLVSVLQTLEGREFVGIFVFLGGCFLLFGFPWLHRWVRENFIDRAEEYFKDNFMDRFSQPILLQVKDGEVIAAEESFWKEKGVTRHPVLIPPSSPFEVNVSLQLKSNHVEVERPLSIIIHTFSANNLPCGGYYDQELYDCLVRAGYCRISDWVEAAFNRAVVEKLSADKLRQAIKDPEIALEIIEAACNGHFPWQEVSNVMKAEIVINTSDGTNYKLRINRK